MTPFAAEIPLIDRLRDRVPEARKVAGAADLEGVTEDAQVTPALHVLHGGFRLASASDDGSLALYAETWLIVVVVRSAAQKDIGRALHEAAAPLLAGVLRAVLGWQPTPECRPFRAASGPAPIYRGNVAYYPIPVVTEFAALGADDVE